MNVMKLSPHFTLGELCFSQTAARRGLGNSPNAFQIAALIRLCNEVLEPLRNDLDMPIVVSSGFRSTQVNKLVGGTEGSAHTKGCAADIIVPGMRTVDLFDHVRHLGLGYQQIINEFNEWIHISVPERAHDIPAQEALIVRHTIAGNKTERV